MDPRARRSAEALRSSILEIVASTPIDAVTVAEVCRVADVTRDTFYRHAATPAELLAATLAAEIAEIARLTTPMRLPEAEAMLLKHVHARAGIYRNAMHPTLVAPVREALERVLREGLRDWLDRHPEIMPDAVDGAFGRDVAIAYAAGGTVSAIEVWIRGGNEDVATATRTILAASPECWLR